MAVNFTDLVDPFKAEWFSDPGQFLPELTAGGFVVDTGAMSVDDATFAEGVKWYRYISFTPEENRLAIQLELIVKGNAVRNFFRALQTWVMFCNRMLHGIFGVGEDYSIGQVPTWAHREWPFVSASGGSGYVDIIVRWDGDPDNDPKNITTTHLEVNPEWTPGDPEETHYNTIQTGFALPPGGIVKWQSPSKLRLHAGLVCFKVICSESITSGQNFTLRCWGTMGALAGEDDPNAPETGNTIEVSYQFYPAHASEPWKRLRKTYPFFAKPTSVTLEGPTAGVHDLLSARVWPETRRCTATVIKDDDSFVNLSAVPLIKIIHTGGGGYKTQANLTSFDLTDVARIIFSFWAESTDDDACVVGQGRCGNDQEDFSLSWGTTEAGCKHTCAKRFTASGIADYRVGGDVGGGCFLHNACDEFLLEPWPNNPLEMYGQLLWGHPYVYEQLIVGDAESFQLRRLHTPSMGSEAKMLLQLAEGLHAIKYFWFNAAGFCQRRIEGTTLISDYGFTWLQREDKPLPLRTDDSTWPPPGPAYDLWVRDPEYPGAPDPMNLMKSLVSESDFKLHPYRVEGTIAEYFGRYQRFREFSVLFWDMPAAGVTSKAFPDGQWDRGSWTFGAQTFTNRFKILPFRFGRGQRGWAGGGHFAEIKKVIIDGERFEVYLKNGEWSASTFLGGLAEVSTQWRGGGTNVALPEFLQVRNWGSGCTVGVDRDRMRPGHVARIDGEDLQGLWVIEAEACYMGAGAEVDSWKVDPGAPGTEAEFYEDNIEIHGEYSFGGFGSLPRDYENWGNRCDRVVLLDKAGEWAAKGAPWFVGKILTCLNDGVLAAEPDPEVTLRDSQDGFETRIEEAEGRLYTTDIDEGNSLALTGKFADRMAHINFGAITALRKLLSNCVSEIA